MKFWNLLAFVEDDQLLDAAVLSEELGFDAVGVSDHLFIPEVINSPYPFPKGKDTKPFFTIEQKWSFPDPFVALSMMAAKTQKVKLFQSIYIMAPRNPLEVAKATGTLATLAPGRLKLCPAVGWMKDEFDQYGVDFTKRGKRTDEMIEVLRKLWSGEIVEHKGEFFEFPRLRSMPCPGNVPVISCGPSEPVMRRAARLCEGWMDAWTDFATLPDRLATLKQMRVEAGREHEPFEIIIIPAAQMGGKLTVDDLRRAEDMGVTAMQFNPAFFHLGRRSTLDDKRRLWEDFAENIMRHFA